MERSSEKGGLLRTAMRPGRKWEPRAQTRDSLFPGPHPCPPSEGRRKGGLRKDPHAVAGVESSLRVTRCRQILQSLPEHSYTVLSYLMGFLHEVSGPSQPQRCRNRPTSGSHPLSASEPHPGPKGPHPRPDRAAAPPRNPLGLRAGHLCHSCCSRARCPQPMPDPL